MMAQAGSNQDDAGRTYDVIVVGGSFVGMAFALAAASAGLKVGLFAAEPLAASDQGDSRASAITAASARMLHKLGVWQGVAGDAQPVSGMAISDGRLDDGVRPPFLLFDTEKGARDHGPATYIVANVHLRAVLAGAVARDKAISVHVPAPVTGFSRQDAMIAVQSAGGAARARVLVAADGARSRLRDMAGIRTVNWDYDQWGLAAPIALTRDHGGKAVQHFLPSGPFAFLPLKGRRGSLVWSEPAEQAKRLLEMDEAALLDELHLRLGHEFGRARLEAPLRGYPLRFAMARSFVAPRFALVGDAAHHVHPLTGQGLNLGLKDAAALAETLAEAARLGLDTGSQAVLERYQRWRRFDAATLAAATDGLNRLFSNDSGPVRFLRDIGLGLVERMPGLKDWMVREAAGDTGTVPRLMKGEGI